MSQFQINVHELTFRERKQRTTRVIQENWPRKTREDQGKILMKIRGKRRRNASVIARRWRRSGSAIEISTSRWSPVINRIVSDPPGQPPANRYLDRSKAAPHANSGRIMRGKGA